MSRARERSQSGVQGHRGAVVQAGRAQGTRLHTGEQSLGVQGEDGLDGAMHAIEAVGLKHALHQLLAVLQSKEVSEVRPRCRPHKTTKDLRQDDKTRQDACVGGGAGGPCRLGERVENSMHAGWAAARARAGSEAAQCRMPHLLRVHSGFSQHNLVLRWVDLEALEEGVVVPARDEGALRRPPLR